MIEKMQIVHIVTTVSKKQEMIDGLGNIGVVHLAERKSADKEVIAKVDSISRAISVLKEYKKKGQPDAPILSDDDFEEFYCKVLTAIERKAVLTHEIGVAQTELDRIQAWGDFTPDEVSDLRNAGYDLHFYTVGSAELESAKNNADIKFIRLASVDKMHTIAVLGTLPFDIPATEFTLPEKSVSELKKTISDCELEIAQCNEVLKNAAAYEASFKAQIINAKDNENYSSACASAESDDELVWISGYVPTADVDKFKKMAESNGCAWMIDEVADDDDKVPTKLRYTKVSSLLKPVYSILGITPGYREQDITLWFLLFFAMFFAMIIGDGGYGMLILLGTLGYTIKTKKKNDAVFLLIVLSVTTIVWGAITGTWFGMESAMKVPALRALVIPAFANYPEYFPGITSSSQQNAVMKLSFTLGAIQMALGSILSVKKKFAEKNLSWVADVGWTICVIAMYLLSLSMVIGENISMAPIFALIGVAFVIVVLFGGMSPDKSFGAGLKAGLADAFTVFLNTISCFGNVMSYIRLFAVGLAGLAIAQSFNAIGAGFNGPLLVVGMIVVFIGHALNIVMAFLSVIVHGVRLNVMEFSGQAGLEWTGIAYDPFKSKNSNIQKGE